LELKSVSLPAEKFTSTRELLSVWAAPGATFLEHDAASLHGKLVHLSSIYHLIRPFLPSITKFAHSFHSKRAKLHPPQDVLADISWIRFLLPHLPRSVPLSLPVPTDINWWGDASTSFGIGVVVGHHWAIWKWAPGFLVGPKQDFDIGWAEAVAVELGLHVALSLGFVGVTSGAPGNFLVRSDNEGVIAVLRKGRSRSKVTNQILKHIYVLQANSGILLHPIYVPSRLNIADALSRGDITSFLKGFPLASSRVHIPLPDHLSGKLILW
jgi:hypothetical protein